MVCIPLAAERLGDLTAAQQLCGEQRRSVQAALQQTLPALTAFSSINSSVAAELEAEGLAVRVSGDWKRKAGGGRVHGIAARRHGDC